RAQADRDESRRLPAEIGNPVVLESELTRRVEHLDLAAIAHALAVPIDGHHRTAADARRVLDQVLSFRGAGLRVADARAPPAVHPLEARKFLPHKLGRGADMDRAAHAKRAVFRSHNNTPSIPQYDTERPLAPSTFDTAAAARHHTACSYGP